MAKYRSSGGGGGAPRLATSMGQLGDVAGRAADRIERLGARHNLAGIDAVTGKVTALTSVLQGGLVSALTRTAAGFNAMFSALSSGFGLANNQLVQLAAAQNPAAAVQLDQAMRSLSYTMGQIFQPILQGSIRFLRGLADTLYNLSPTTKALIAGIGAATIAFGALATAATAASIAINSGLGGLPLVLGALAAALVGAGGGAAYLATTSEKLLAAMKPLGDLFNDLLDVAEEFIESGMEVLAEAVTLAAGGFRELWQAAAPLRDELVKLGKAAGPLLIEVLKLGVALAQLAMPILDVLVPAIKVLTAALAEMTRAATLGVVVLTTLARRTLEGTLGDFAGTIAEIEGRLADLDRKRDRSARAPFMPKQATFTNPEEFARRMQASALTAAFGMQKDDPAKRAEKQRDQQTAALRNIEAGINKVAVAQEKQSAEWGEIQKNALKALGPLGDYIRQARGGR